MAFFKWGSLFLFFATILVELWLVLTIGAYLGVGLTIGWMIVSFLLGLALLRIEGVMVLVKIRRQLMAEVIPGRELLDMVFIVAGGILLILPGFLTDFVGLAFLFPPFRWAFGATTRAMLRRLFHFSVEADLREEDGEPEIIDVTQPPTDSP